MAGIQSIRSSLDGIVVKLIVGVIIIAFVGSIGWSVFFSSTDVNVVAIVDDHEIDINDLNFEMRAQNFYFQERFKDFIEVKDVVDFINSNSPKAKLNTSAGLRNYCPTKKLKLTVNKEIAKTLLSASYFFLNLKSSSLSAASN